MRILDFNMKRYDIPLVKPIIINNQKLHHRSGVIIFLTTSSGLIGYGEAAPLPYFHKENLDEVISQLAQLKNTISNLKVSSELLAFDGGLSDLLSINIFPSVRFAIETAIFNLLIQQDRNFSGSKTADIGVNGLAMGNTDDLVSEVDSLLKQGYFSIKIKIGKRPLEEDIKIIQALQKITTGKAILRLDANRSWQLEEAVTFGTRISPGGIEYIEEPTKSIEGHIAFFKKTKIPIALDETLAEKVYDNIKDVEHIKAFVLKPSIIGGFERTAQLVRFAQKNNITPVISSTFQSSIALKAMAIFAAKMGITNTPIGLDTLKWFAEDLPVNPLKIKNGKINIQRILKDPAELRMDLLKDI